jgi:hypothetical protein
VRETPSTRAAASASRSSTTRSASHLALAGGQLRNGGLELGREPGEVKLLGRRLVEGEPLFAPPAAGVGPEVVERGRASDAAEPGDRRRPSRVVAPPLLERLLERGAGQVVGEAGVGSEHEQVAIDLVQAVLGDR